MKKIGILLVMYFIFNFSQVNAQAFNMHKKDGYMYKLIENNTSTIKYMYMITDNNKKAYYNCEPKSTMFSSTQYEKSKLLLDEDVYKKIAKIIYYGYGYQNHTTEEYYFATQYLIFEELEGITVEIIDKDRNTSDYASKEINEIKETIEKNSFISKAYHTNEDYIIIDEPYILEHFNIVGDGISVEEVDSKYKINLLETKEEYQIKLKSKNKCLPANYWASSTASDLIGQNNLCEEDNYITIINDKKEVVEENEQTPTEPIPTPEVSEEEKNESNDYIIEEEIEVIMPSTSKYSSSWLFLLILLGNLYYVCKK